MKAVVTTKYGGPEVLEIQERETPIPKANEVLIKVHTTTVSVGDVKMRSLDVPPVQRVLGRMFLGWTKPKQDILGMEVAGEIVEIGAEVTTFKVGDQVFASTFWSGLGGHAEYNCIPEDGMIAIKPANLSFEEVVPLLGGGVTAAKVLKKGNIQPGHKVLIYGASGNVGTFAVQIAKHFGAIVTGVCSTRNLEMVRGLGADKVVDYTKEDFTQNGEMYDIVFDAVDKIMPSQRKASLNKTGIYLNVSKDSGSGVGKAKDHIEYLILLKGLLDAGEIKSVIDGTYSFEEIPQAHKYVETGRKRGCVVINVIESS
ncbi:MAG: NAD(P)-dependent alcohol dehydrogenase [Candidatus Thorarchaeota archaeon]